MSKGKILVVDDDRLVLATLSYGLTQAGFEVIDADNGDDAILLAREHRPELALLDIRMEGLTGFDVAAYLREFLQTPFMFLSAFTDEATVAKVKELGAVAYLVKPLDISQIVPAVEAAFARSTTRSTPPVATSAPAAPAAMAQAFEAPSELPSMDVTALAVGVLMHRYSLPRDEALARLMSLASADGHSLPEQARRVVDALELLARPGQK
ncbi:MULTISPECIES: response regulator [unclassified Roseateles]|uniref:response regulator n=1 Tax=Pelomonas sp. Root1237 TaxID=1736434 RepID=UPI0006FC2979|nr:response regulator [Pelomonas sp. Root1237]KQV89594.1 response regulator [Pelomonas sp. Root1237]